MTSVILIPWGKTDWSRQGRLAATTGLPLNDQGRQDVAQWADDLEGESPTIIYAGRNETAVETGTLLAKMLHAKFKALNGLEGPSLGLWEGLAVEDLGQRFPKVFRQWREQPLSICPPEGEPLSQAADRLGGRVSKLVAKHPNGTIGIVLGPIAMAAVRCIMENLDLNQLWDKHDDEPTCHRIDLLSGELALQPR
jgi:broad specificity phosphatase PhoE